MKYKRQPNSFSILSDDELLRRLSVLLQQSRRVESELVAHIGEVDARKLYARFASSMFTYCTKVLHLSEHEAYLRIAVARASRKHPALLEMLADGRLHLSGIAKLAPQLTEANRETLLERAAHKSKSQIEEMVAAIAPKPDVPAMMRKLPVPRKKIEPAAPLQLGPDRVETSASSRYIPAPVKRAVHERDRGQCSFVDPYGRRCTERDRLEFHHRKPFGLGGDHSVGNIHLMCKAHNGYFANRDYGKEVMERHKRPPSSRGLAYSSFLE